VQALQQLAHGLRHPILEWLGMALQTTLCLLEGNLDEATRLSSAARRLGERSVRWDSTVFFRVQTFAILREQARLGEMEPAIRRSVEEYPTRPLFRCLLVVLYCDLGQLENGRRVLAELACNHFLYCFHGELMYPPDGAIGKAPTSAPSGHLGARGSVPPSTRAADGWESRPSRRVIVTAVPAPPPEIVASSCA